MSLSHYSFLRPCGHFDVFSTVDVVVVDAVDAAVVIFPAISASAVVVVCYDAFTAAVAIAVAIVIVALLRHLTHEQFSSNLKS